MSYAIKHEGKVFTPDGKTDIKPDQVDAHNAELTAQELAVWATAPDRFAVYIVKKTDPTMKAMGANAGPETWHMAETFTGARLSKGRVSISRFRTNMSRNMVAVRFEGTNGATYYGRYGADWSQLCRVRKAK